MKKEPKHIRLAIAQINTCVGNFTGNTQKIISYIDQAKSKNASIVVFPELSIPGYPPEDLLFKKSFIDENLSCLKEIKACTQGLSAVVGFVDEKKGILFNSAAILANGKMVEVYHKRHLPNYGVFDEKRYFSAGEEKFSLYKAGDLCFALNICEDIWVSDEQVFSSLKNSADLIIVINASPYHIDKIVLRQKVLRRRAKESNSFILYANLVGGQDELVFDGQSMFISSRGVVLARAGAFKEELLILDLDLNKLPKKSVSKNTKIFSLNVPEKLNIISSVFSKKAPILGREEEVFNGLVMGTADYARKNSFTKVVLGLSGGIDSSIVACIAMEALGRENVIGVLMPSRFNSQVSFDDAAALAKNLGIEYKVIKIEEAFEKYQEILGEHFLSRPWNVAEENLQARVRGNILMALSNKFGWLVLTTGNKSEMSVGYATLYGDMAGGFAVIKDVPKTFIYKLAEFYNRKMGCEIIPHNVLVKAPTAELRENQKDTDSLPPYDVLDPILKYYIEEDRSLSYISKKGFKAEDIIKVSGLVDKSEYKRRQSPPGIKITPRAFGRDRRFPVTNKFREKF